jgi:hypothetical protein
MKRVATKTRAKPKGDAKRKPKKLTPKEQAIYNELKKWVGISPLAGKMTTEEFMKDLRGHSD